MTLEEAKVMKCVMKHMRGRHGSEKTTVLSRWIVQRMRKDGFNASLYQTSWSTSLGCPAGWSFLYSVSSVSQTLLKKYV